MYKRQVKSDVIKSAKDYAEEQNRSLSSIVEEYLKSLTHKTFDETAKLSKEVMKLKGSVKIDADDLNYKETLTDALVDKYLKK